MSVVASGENPSSHDDEQGMRSRWWFFGGLMVVTVACAALEQRDPAFFCQDDALVLEFPCVLAACRGLWQGLVPEYNPWQFLGSPHLSTGGIYPPIVAAYAFARHVLGDEYATLDVFAIAHLLIGYVLAYMLARRGTTPPFAMLAATTFVLAGPLIVMARCWISFATLAVFVPLLALFADRLADGPVTWRWSLWAGVSLGLLYHAGFPQLFVLGAGFFLLHAVMLATVDAIPARRLGWVVPALVIATAIAMPVVFQQWRLSREMQGDTGGGGEGIAAHLAALFLPYPLVSGTLPNGWGNVNLQWGGHFYFFGGMLLFVFLIWIWQSFTVRQLSPSLAQKRRLALGSVGVVAFFMALGEGGGLWWAMHLLPTGLRNNPFRAMPWMVLPVAVVGAAVLGELISRRWVDDRHRRFVTAVTAAGGLGLLAYHVTHLTIAFYTYGFFPYPPLPEDVARVLRPHGAVAEGRVLSVAAMRSSDPTYPAALPHNLSSLHEVPVFFGYNPLIQRLRGFQRCLESLERDPRRALAAYGIRWVLVHRSTNAGPDESSPNRFERVSLFRGLLQTLDLSKIVPLDQSASHVAILEVPEACPLAFSEHRPEHPLPVRFDVSGAQVTLDPAAAGTNVVVNVLAYPDFVALVDDVAVPVRADAWRRVVVATPPGGRTLRLAYRPPWMGGIGLSAALAFLAGGCLMACRRLGSC